MSGLKQPRKRGIARNSDNPYYRKKPTQERLKFLFDYREDGEFIRKNLCSYRSRAKVGEIVKGGFCTDGYKQIYIDGVYYLLHRMIWLWHHGYDSENLIDHIDQDRRNCRIDNLREASPSCNSRNSKTHDRNKTGIKSVTTRTRHGRTFYSAMIRYNNSLRHLGDFNDLVEAVCHRLAAETCLKWNACDINSPSYLYLKEQGIVK